MPKNIGLSLSGTNNISLLNLTGLTYGTNCHRIPILVKKLKINIMNTIIIPFMSKNWKSLKENLVFFENIKQKLTEYYNRYKLEELQIYSYLIEAFENAIFLQMELNNLEEVLYGSNCTMATMVFKTTMIRLKPEIELYNLILGTPKLKFGEKYNIDVLKDLEVLLKVDNITFEKIKNYIIAKYYNILSNI